MVRIARVDQDWRGYYTYDHEKAPNQVSSADLRWIPDHQAADLAICPSPDLSHCLHKLASRRLKRLATTGNKNWRNQLKPSGFATIIDESSKPLACFGL